MNETKMKIRIDESKSLLFHLKKERIPLPTSQEDPPKETTPEAENQPPATASEDPDVTAGTNPIPKKKKTTQFRFVYSHPNTKILYQKLLLQIPQWKGTILVFGIRGDEEQALEICRSEENLRKEFARQIKKINNRQVDRFTWMENLLLSGNYKHIKIYYSSTF